MNLKSAAPPVRRAPMNDRVKDRRRYAVNVRRLLAAGARRNRREVLAVVGGSHSATWLYQHALAGQLRTLIPLGAAAAGKGAEYVRTTLAEVLAKAKPLQAVIMAGSADDKSTPAAVAKAVARLSAAVDVCLRNGTVPILATIPPYHGADQSEEKRFNEALVKMARKKRVPVSYCFEALTAAGADKVFTETGSLSPAGVDAAAGALRETFDQIRWAARDSSGRLR